MMGVVYRSILSVVHQLTSINQMHILTTKVTRDEKFQIATQFVYQYNYPEPTNKKNKIKSKQLVGGW